MKKILLLGVLLLLFGRRFSYAQNDQNAISISGIKGIKAFSTYTSSLQGGYDGFEVGYLINMQNNEVDWVKALQVNDIAIKASYENLQHISFSNMPGTKGVFGNNYSLIAALDMTLLKLGGTKLIFSPGVGVGYATQDFYTTHNNNFVMGSHLNVEAKGELKIETPVFSGVSLQGGVSFWHISNSGMILPNCGLNGFSFSAGLIKEIAAGPENHTPTFAIDSKNLFFIESTIGSRGAVKTGYVINQKTGRGMYPDTAIQGKTPGLPQAALSIGYERRLSSVFGLTIGTDAMYSFREFDWNNFFRTYQGDFTSYSHVTAGINVGADVWLGRVVFSGNYGRYVLGKFLYADTRSYVTFSGKFFITTWMAINAKAYIGHFGSAGLAFYIH